jgi:hypothetical protein
MYSKFAGVLYYSNFRLKANGGSRVGENAIHPNLGKHSTFLRTRYIPNLAAMGLN